MKLSEIKEILKTVEAVNFELPDGALVPEYFHVTEVGLVTKTFIDCGGTVRKETVVNFQLWNANDYDHRLKPQKLIQIIELSEKVLGIENHDIEVEYQNTTIGKYALDFNGKNFILLNKQTACLAQDQCGVPSDKPKIKLSQFQSDNANSCTPGGSCC
ncbi:DUF6428 family protein [Flavobacterium foetidum]|uniref:DUF6428 family protein n=1 Tax=Flavobacterium foetidum TaxID=2026681 RepID=UPI0010755587|nr:DUF6428 family protein [Flavobacterium foetidum]KAF2515690.1 hypothetical protein E0W73_08865 [Flavobacterium foetidum]